MGGVAADRFNVVVVVSLLVCAVSFHSPQLFHKEKEGKAVKQQHVCYVYMCMCVVQVVRSYDIIHTYSEGSEHLLMLVQQYMYIIHTYDIICKYQINMSDT